ncbi:replicative DNA helicase [bacterium]|nr:replicative DNA helicase [bacterium]
MAEVQAKVPPHDLEAERLVLGGILIDNSQLAAVSEVITAKAFYFSPHQHIYDAMFDLYDKDLPLDLLTLKDELLRREKLEKVGGMAYLSRLVAEVSAVTNIRHYAGIMSEKYVLRSLIAACSNVVDKCYKGADDVGDLITLAERAVADATEQRSSSSIVSMDEVVRENLELLEKIAAGEKKVAGVPTGFTELDELMLGLHPGDLIIVGSRPSVGKTSWCLNVAHNAAAKEHVPVLIFTIEMSKEEITNRMLASKSGVSLTRIRAGKLSHSDRDMLKTAGEELSGMPILIDDSASLSPLEMRARAKQAKIEHNIGIAMVDYLQLMHYQRRTENRQQEVTAISRSLKTMARELDIAVVAFSQLSRDVAKRRENRTPQLADLRESGSLEQDADVVIFLHDPARGAPNKKGEPQSRPDNAEIDIIVAKQRNGPTASLKLLFQTKYASFKNISKEAPPPWVVVDDQDADWVEDDEL